MSDTLKLLAMDAEDLTVLSAALQDATIRLDDMTYLPGEHKFACVVNRLSREEPLKRRFFSRAKPQRRRTGLHFNGVTNASHKGLNNTKGVDVLNLLAIIFEEDEQPSGNIQLIFSDGAEIKLSVECIEAEMSDLGPIWEANAAPKHAV